MNQQKVYAPLNCKEAKNQFGSYLRVGFNAQKMIDFIQTNVTEGGFINLDIIRRKEEGRFGETHTAVLNTWKPSKDVRPQQDPAVRKPTVIDPEDVP